MNIRSPLLLGLLLSSLVFAQPLPQTGQNYQSKTIDLNGDGKVEKVVLSAYNIDKNMEGHWGQLRVLNGQGKPIWEAPKTKNVGQPFAFGSWPYGVTGIEWLGDIDGDKKIELLAPRPISDVSPKTYLRYRWNGKAFISLGPKMLLESPIGSGRFLWKDPVEWDGSSALSWVMTLSGDPKEKAAEIMTYGIGGEFKSGQAVMKGDGLGLTVVSWKRPLASP